MCCGYPFASSLLTTPHICGWYKVKLNTSAWIHSSGKTLSVFQSLIEAQWNIGTDTTHLKVHYSSRPIVLLCGGFVKEKSRPEDPEPLPQSLRHAVNYEALHSAPPFLLFQPEEIKHWAMDATFKNLMEFEKELASVSSIVVIILESAGAIAELSAFSQLPELNKKLIVFRSSHYGSEDSFIDLGVLRYIKADYGENKVKKYRWIPSVDNQPAVIANNLPNDVLEDITDEVKELKKTSKFNKLYDTHIAALICELISIFTALRESELLTLLQNLNIDISRDELKRKIFILRHFTLIDTKEASSSIFYFKTDDEFHAVNGFTENGHQLDKLRKKTVLMEEYKKIKDRHRLNAISQIGHYQ